MSVAMRVPHEQNLIPSHFLAKLYESQRVLWYDFSILLPRTTV